MILKRLSKKFITVSMLAFTGGFTMPQAMSQAYAAPIEFKDTNAATQWAEKHYGNWRSSLSSNELQAIDYYTRGGDVHINKRLDWHHGDELIRGKEDDFGFPAQFDSIAKNIHFMAAALAKKTIPEDIVVYSTIPWDSQILAKDPFSGEDLNSEAYREKLMKYLYYNGTAKASGYCFMNTSLIRENVHPGRAVLYLTVPKGTKGAYLGTGSAYDGKELLLERGYYYKINNIDKEPRTDKWRVHAEITLNFLKL
ncbi:ADP-ribosyltransferase [Bacillus cereus]|uniref:ADP-ribosyltransferase n=1 Tax=Bacillus cereus TaxID=1396 RepID=UPI000BEE5DEF|nr:ADP-ribosyltransferase [Bacillus cereus]PEF69081.1 hypothetical protein CON35_08370 [Bacillus cereus]